MFDSKSPVVKIVGYLILGFLTIIIIISFGMPDFMSRLGLDTGTVAVVNGQKIHFTEYMRFRNMYARDRKGPETKEQTQMIVNSLVRDRLVLQLAEKIGIRISDERVKEQIRMSPAFHDQNGRFNGERFKNLLHLNRWSVSEYYDTVRSDLTKRELMNLYRLGSGVVPDEILKQYIVETAQLQAQYCLVTAADLRERHRAEIVVSEADIDEEMKKNRSEIKDPKSDRERVRKKLEDKKLEGIRSKLITQVDELAAGGKSFAEAVALLRGRVAVSEKFRIGEPLREQGPNGKVLSSLGNSKIFTDDFLALEPGKTSKVVSAGDGLYVFTPMAKNIPDSIPPAYKTENAESRLAYEQSVTSINKLLEQYWKKSNIKINLKDKDAAEE